MKKWSVVLAVAALVALPAFAAEPAEKVVLKASKLCSEGNELLAKGDVDQASSRFEDALRLVPDFVDGHAGLGNVAMKRGNAEGAAREYQAAIDSYRAMVQRRKARELQRLQAIQRQNEGLRDDLNNVNSPQSKSGGALATLDRQNKMDRTRNETLPDKVREGEDVPAELFFLLGGAEFRRQRVDEALAAWETSAKARPDFAPVHNNLAVAYMMKKRFADAKASLAKAEQLGAQVNPRLKADIDAGLAAEPKS